MSTRPPTERQLTLRPGFGAQGTASWLRANYFEVQLPKTSIFLYEISFTPAVKTIGLRKHLHALLRQSPTFKNIEKHVATDGSQYLVSCKPLDPNAVSTPHGRDTDSLRISLVDGQTTYKVDIQRRAEISPSAVMDHLSGKRPSYEPGQAVQALNILLAKFPRDQPDIVPLGGNRFFVVRKELECDLRGGLVARKGFYSSIRPSIGRMLVNVNVCTKAFYKTGPLVELIAAYLGGPKGQAPTQNQFRNLQTFLKGLRVSDSYGRNKKRRVRTINFLGSAPKDVKFVVEDAVKGTRSETNVQAFFLKEFERRLDYPNLPTIGFLGRNKARIEVPAELFTVDENQPCGNDNIAGDQIASIMNFACVQPAQNAKLITRIGLPALGFQGTSGARDYLSKFDIKINAEMVAVPARVLPSPTVQYMGSTENRRATWNLQRSKFVKGAKMDSWTYFVIEDVDPKRKVKIDRQLLERFQDVFRKSGLGISQCNSGTSVAFDFNRLMQNPAEMENATQKIEQKLRSLSEKKKSKIVLVILDLARPKPIKAYGPVYAAVKYVGDVKCGVATVCCQWDKLKGQSDQYIANIAMKFNAKLGGVNHQLGAKDLGILNNKKAMLVGCDVTHASPKSRRGTPSIAGVVASIDSKYATYPASIRLQEHRTEMITDLKEMMVERLKLWNTYNNSYPDHVLIFRDGVSEGEFSKVLDIELPKIKDAFKACGAKMPYKPKVTVIIVGKRHHTRFYPSKADQADMQYGQGNPLAGTVVDRGVTSVYDFDFFLQAHQGQKGTARPAHYYVIHDENNFTADSLQQLTHSICYLFARATKAVSIVPPAYYADILCERGRCYINGLCNTAPGSSSASTAGSTKASDAEKGQTMAEAKKLWGNGVHPDVKNTMFYL
ncbi:ribonuclease H-like domain-containing protein [Sphaerosporella brunnea]|uniref:Ribonuclease H-like domain-containing protein n=1 Tax=Sphaerosporella brunnea TaxID=1250544 RepID=A0A5J5EIM7_9PEZI|nr:ribonuclease H-like domain-containing protein [Sphaerosporella brunnea]